MHPKDLLGLSKKVVREMLHQEPSQGSLVVSYLRLSLLILKQGRTARDEIFMYDETTKCVPYAMYDSWNHYQWAGPYEEPPVWAGTYGAQSPVFSKPEVKKFQARFEEFIARFPADGPSQEETTTWLAKQEAANGLVVSQLQKIEQWMENDRKLREKDRADIREARAVFFVKGAARLDPPLEEGVLALCPSYCRSIEIAKPATEKSWQILRDKVKAEREHAAELYVKKKRLEDIRGYREFLVNNRDETIRNRQQTHSEEHCLVLKLGTTVVERILNDPQGIHDLDLVNVILQEVYEEFEKLDDSEKPTNGYGPYRLLMDDARLVYNEIILPLIDRFSCQSRQTITKARLKCPVKDCRQPEHVADFLRLMEHLHTYHGNILDLDILLIHLRGFPWYTLEWPRNLPMLSAHQEAGEAEWDMDSHAAYNRFPQRTDYGVGQAINQYLLTHAASESVTMTDTTYHAICDLNHIPFLNRYECQRAIGRAHLRQLRSMKPLNFYENINTLNTLNTMIERKPPNYVHSITDELPRLDDFCSFRCLLDMSTPCNANNAFSAPELMQQFGANFNSDSEDSGSDSGDDCSSCGESDLEFAHTLSMLNSNDDIGTAYFGARFPPLLN